MMGLSECGDRYSHSLLPAHRLEKEGREREKDIGKMEIDRGRERRRNKKF